MKNHLETLNNIITTLESLLEIFPDAKLLDNLAKLKETRKMIEQTSLFTEVKRLGRGTWIVDITHGENGTYYQFDKLDEHTGIVTLARHGKSHETTITYINAFFRLATVSDIQRHLTYLASKGYPKLGDEIESYITLKPEFKRFTQACATIAVVKTFPNEVRVDGGIYTRLKEAGVLEWFDTVTRSASTEEITFNPLNCEFYMVTCLGDKGSKVRHADYDTAVKEAKRIAKIENHPAWVVGVVAKINP